MPASPTTLALPPWPAERRQYRAGIGRNISRDKFIVSMERRYRREDDLIFAGQRVTPDIPPSAVHSSHACLRRATYAH